MEPVRKIQSPQGRTVNVRMEMIVPALLEAPEQTSDHDGPAHGQCCARQYMDEAAAVGVVLDDFLILPV